MACPDRLYKYQSLSAYSLAGLLNGTIWLSKPAAFNDPLDCAITLDRERMDESIQDAIGVALAGTGLKDLDGIRPSDREAFEAHRSQILGLLQNMGVCSFSAVSNHLLMWSHYATHHRGFCIEYDSSEGSQLRGLAKEVLYSDDAPSLTAKDIASHTGGSSLEILWLTKAACWSYEHEWRVIMSEGNKPFQAPSKIVSVIFGARMPESDRTMIAYALRNEAGISFKEARLVDGKFLLEIVDA